MYKTTLCTELLMPTTYCDRIVNEDTKRDKNGETPTMQRDIPSFREFSDFYPSYRRARKLLATRKTQIPSARPTRHSEIQNSELATYSRLGNPRFPARDALTTPKSKTSLFSSF